MATGRKQEAAPGTKTLEAKALRFMEMWLQRGSSVRSPADFAAASSTTETSESTESSEATETSESSENSENKEGKESSEDGTEHSETSESSESTESSEDSENSETTEGKESADLFRILFSVDPDPDEWGSILKIVEPVLISPIKGQ